MRASLFLAVLALAACQRESASEPAPPAAAAAASPTRGAEIEGWKTSEEDYMLFGATTPEFTAKNLSGADVKSESLRGRWTILAFWGLWSDDSLADARYISALNSAADQDPDLDFLSVHTPPGPGRGAEALGGFKSIDAWFKTRGHGWPTLADNDGKIAEAFHIQSEPTYLLIGPDLTIEGYRTDLSKTPDDGIKSVIRGVAQIRKQIAAPG